MNKKIYPILFMLVMAVCCKEKFTPKLDSPVTGYLVVEGIINSGIGTTTITLSRTSKVDSMNYQAEDGAIMQIEGNDNTVYNLQGGGGGYYQTNQLNLNSAQQYRLRIKTQDGKEYLSDFVDAKDTPPIDSVGWTYDNDGVHITASTHDPNNNTKYYYWKYEETWEYNMPFIPELKTVDTILNFSEGPTYMVVPASYDPLLRTCWNSETASSILIGSSARLREDIIDNAPIAFVPRGSVKISSMYSILVKQYGLSADAYAFLSTMKKNTEQTGSVFDPQPSQLKVIYIPRAIPTKLSLGLSLSLKNRRKEFLLRTVMCLVGIM